MDDSSSISIEEFKKVELRVGTIVDVQEIPKSKKLLKLIVDFGNVKKQAIAGIKEQYKKEDLIGKQYVFVYNLEPKEIFGEKSECMILAAEEDNKIVLIKPEKPVKNGTILK